MNALLLPLLLLATQDQTAEAKKLLDGLAPKDPGFAQFEFENGTNRTGTGYFAKGKAWRLDTKWGETEMIFMWDAKAWTNYMKKSNRFISSPKETSAGPLIEGGALAEIYYSGNGDRLLKGNKATVTREKLDGTDCFHVVIPRPDMTGFPQLELHLWIDASKTLIRYTRKWVSQGKVSEQSFTYKIVDPPTADKSVFDFKVPADAKNIRGN